MHITVKKGLDIPLLGCSSGNLKKGPRLRLIALNLSAFPETHFKVLVKEGDVVKIGEPLAYDKQCPERVFVSPACGTVHEITRGLKRRLLNIVIASNGAEDYVQHTALNVQSASRDEIVELLLQSGLFPHIRQRPCDVFADPSKKPNAIIVNAVASAPFAPPPEMAVRGHETDFQLGLNALHALARNAVHLVYRRKSNLQAFTHAENAKKHTVSGPHPSGNSSVHIEHIAPILSHNDVVWTVSAEDVVRIGRLFTVGVYDPRRLLAVAGEGIAEDKRGLYETVMGCSFKEIVGLDEPPSDVRVISGDPLIGTKVDGEDFLCFYHNTFSCIPEMTEERELMHFFRLGRDKYTATKTYASGFLQGRRYPFSTHLHGEKRAFVDPLVYDDVMPLNIPTMQLVKAVLAEDYELAEDLGILEVSAEDFALPTFICPSKVEMVDIMRRGLAEYFAQYLQ